MLSEMKQLYSTLFLLAICHAYGGFSYFKSSEWEAHANDVVVERSAIDFASIEIGDQKAKEHDSEKIQSLAKLVFEVACLSEGKKRRWGKIKKENFNLYHECIEANLIMDIPEEIECDYIPWLYP